MNKIKFDEIDFSEVSNCFYWLDSFWGKRNFTLINKNGQVHNVKVTNKIDQSKFDDIINHWQDLSKKSSLDNYHSYPVGLVFKEFRSVILSSVLIFLWSITVFVSFFINGSLESSNLFFVFLIFLILDSIYIAVFLLKIPMRYNKVGILDDLIITSCINGKIEKYSFDNIKKYNIASRPADCSYIIFKNRKKLSHLERLSYWPILREQLLSKLEGEKKVSED